MQRGLYLAITAALFALPAWAEDAATDKDVVSNVPALYPPQSDFTKNCIAAKEVIVPAKDWSAWGGTAAGALPPKEMLDVGRFYLDGNAKVPSSRILARKIFMYVASTKTSYADRAKIELARMSLLEKPLFDYIEPIHNWASSTASRYPRESYRILGELEEAQEHYEKAAEYYRKALKEGDGASSFDLAKFHRSNSIKAVAGEDPDQLVKLGQNVLLSNLGKGDCTTLYAFGMLYTRSRAVTRNEDAAVQWFEASIKGLHDRASILRAAELYKAGIGIPGDVGKAIGLWEDAANNGSTRAMQLLAEMYQKGDGVPADLDKSIFWYEKAASLYHLKSIEALAEIYTDPVYGHQNEKKAFKWLNDASQQPNVDPRIWVKLGDAYALGQGVDKSHEEAFKWYEKAAKAGNTEGIFRLGEAYRYGLGAGQDIKRSLRFYRLAANLGNDDAIMMMAENYEKGIGVKADEAKRRRWLERGAAGGNSAAQLDLARMLLLQPSKKDKDQAIALLKKASEAGDKRSMVELSLLYQDGTVLEKNEDLSRSWRERAMLPGEKRAEALVELANAMVDGRLYGRTSRDAIPLLEKAVNVHNYDKAAYALGKLYQDGSSDIPVDIEKARSYYEIAARQHNPKALEKLAGSYLKAPEATEEDRKKAIDYYRQAADFGSPEAMRELGMMYLSGKGLPLDAKWGATLLQRAANLGDLGASSELGELYLSGIGVGKDEKRAVEYLTLAANQGSASAMRKLARLYARGIAVEHDPKNFIAWMNKAAEAGDQSAMLEMANAYAAGYGVQESQERAVFWLKKASALGNAQAQQQLMVIEKNKDD